MSDLAVGTMVTPSLRLVRPLRVGGMGSVWVAEHLGLKTQVVVKFIAPDLANKPEAAARFEREAASAAQVKSPHVVQVLDHGLNPVHGPYIVMELLEGQDLGAYLKAHGRLPAREVGAMIAQVARALSKAHALSIVHRDIKPDNIFLCDADGGEVFVKLLDFGIAKADDRIGTGTTTGQVMGTPYYMSPEQLLGEPIDTRTDIWSLGVVAYEALTGKRPFKGETIGALTLSIHSPPPSADKWIPHPPPGFDAWFARVCSKNRDERFASARDAAQALYELCEAAPVEPKQLFSARAPMMSLDLTSAPTLPSDGSPGDANDRPKTELSSTAGIVPPPKRERRSPMVLIAGGVIALVATLGTLGTLAALRTGSDRTEAASADKAAMGERTEKTGKAVGAPSIEAPVKAMANAEVAAPTPPPTPIPSAPASSPAAAAPNGSTPPAASASAPLKSSRHNRPPPRSTRPTDGFNDIK